MNLSQRTLQTVVPLQRMEQRERSWSHVIVNAIADCVQDELESILNTNKFQELASSSTGQEHLAHRLSQDVIQQCGSNCLREIMSLMNKEIYAAEAIDQIHDHVAEFVRPAIKTWEGHSHIFHPRRIFSLNHESEGANYISPLLALLDQRYRSDSRADFERVREAKYRQLQMDDVPQIIDTYQAALLDTKTLELLCKTEEKMPEEEILQRIEEFRKKIRKGVFIWDLEQDVFQAELAGRSLKETGMDLRGRVLEDEESGKILAWLTYKHAPNTPNTRQEKTVKRYLKKGVTGNKIQYDNDSLPYDQFEKNWDKIELFQDIRSLHRFAADRLAALAFSEMKMANPNLRYIFAYRLYDLFVTPQLDFMSQTRSRGILPTQNDKSYSRFFGWGFRHLAYDFNPKESAPRALRKNVNGADRLLNPKWGIIAGSIDDVVENSTREYRDIQIAHGDISQDKFTPGRWTL